MGQMYIIIICIILALFATWREVARSNKKNLPWRIIAVILAIAALACIILPVTYNKELSAGAKNQAVLLTEGFNADSIPASGIPVYTISKSVKKEYQKAILLSSIGDVIKIKPAFSSIKILGYGLNEDQLVQLDSIPVKFIPAKKPGGIQSVNWNSRLKTGETLTIQGSYNNTSGDVVDLVLKGLGTTLDSAAIVPDNTSAFNLKAKPKNTGRAVYRLIAINGKDTLSNESVPIEVFDTKPLNVLILANTPDFENKFLKDWLAVNHYGVAIRSMISKDKYSQEFANIPQQPLGVLTPSLLSKFDVVFSTLDVLKTLKPAEAGALKQQVQQRGLGIIARADSTTHSGSWLQNSFPLNKSGNAGQVISGFKIQGQDNLSTKLLVDPVYIIAQNNIQPLVADQQGHLVAGTALAGAGREVFTTLNNTHSWMLAGNEKDYAAYWTLLISKAAKPITVNSQWTVKTAVPYVNGHTKIQLETSVPNPELKINAERVAAIQQPNIPFAYIADYWPTHAGWQLAQQGNDVPQWWYAYPQTDWQNLKYLTMMERTHAYAAGHVLNPSVTKQIHQKIAIAVPKIYFYILLLLACTYLWAEAKFRW